jgi:hypothetical protein
MSDLELPIQVDDVVYVGDKAYTVVSGQHVKNEHGVLGRMCGRYGNQFVPLCCMTCQYLGYETYDDYFIAYNFCSWGQRMPTKKGTCKRQSGEFGEDA